MAQNLQGGAGQILDGTAISREIRAQLKLVVEELKEKKGIVPGLAMVQVGDNFIGNKFIELTLTASKEVGMTVQPIKLPRSSPQAEILKAVEKLNKDHNVHGIIVLLPLETDEKVDVNLVINTILPVKDVDGLTQSNIDKLARGDLDNCILPSGPKGGLALIQSTGVEIEGKRAVVLGRCQLVGIPMFNLLLWNNATVTICHSKTVNLEEEVLQADILVVGIQKPKFVKGDWIKLGAIVVDFGMNYLPGKAGPVGDVDFDTAKERASWITPVPGGVGPMNVAMLLQNTVDQAKKAAGAANA